MEDFFTQADQYHNQSQEFWNWLLPGQEIYQDQSCLKKGKLQIFNEVQQLVQIILALDQQKIYLFEDENQNFPSKYSDIRFKRIEPFIESSSDVTRYGFRITRGNSELDFYTEDSNQLEDWLSCLCQVGIANDIFNDYSLIRKIGKGNHAVVYLSRCREDQKLYALKVIQKEYIAQSQERVQALEREIDIQRQLNSKFIVNLHRVYEEEDAIYLVLDYLDGEDLYKKISQVKKYQESEAAKFARNMCKALIYLQQQDVIHRDLKLENIILIRKDCSYKFKISDFGLSTKASQNTNQRCGSPGYVAPEILRKEPYGQKADMFSFGVLMYILLTGHSPFSSKEVRQILKLNVHCNITYKLKDWGCISPQALDFVLRLTDPNPEQRMDPMEALHHDWFNTNVNHHLTPIREPIVRENLYMAQLCEALQNDGRIDRNRILRIKDHCNNNTNEREQNLEMSHPTSAFKLLSSLRSFDSNVAHPEQFNHFDGLSK